MPNLAVLRTAVFQCHGFGSAFIYDPHSVTDIIVVVLHRKFLAFTTFNVQAASVTILTGRGFAVSLRRSPDAIRRYTRIIGCK